MAKKKKKTKTEKRSASNRSVSKGKKAVQAKPKKPAKTKPRKSAPTKSKKTNVKSKKKANKQLKKQKAVVGPSKKQPPSKSARGTSPKLVKSSKPTKKIGTQEKVLKKEVKANVRKSPEEVRASKKKLAKPITTLKVILCGGNSLFWLPNTEKIEDVRELLSPQELAEASLRKSDEKRDEYIRARWLYHRVTKLREPLLAGHNRAPSYPKEILGSISHKNGHVVFGYVPTSSYDYLGIDLEALDAFRWEMSTRILLPQEFQVIDRAEALGGLSRTEALAVVFSFKESTIKALNVFGRVQMDEIEVREILTDRKEIRAVLRSTIGKLKERRVHGGYSWVTENNQKYVLTTVHEKKAIVAEQIRISLMGGTLSEEDQGQEVGNPEAENPEVMPE